MDLQKLTFPLMIAAAIVGLWVVLRPKKQAQISNQVSAAPSGLANYLPQAQTYQVNTPQLAAPSQPVILADPYNPNPGLPQSKTPPAYLAFNFGPGHDLSKVPLTQAQLAQMHGDRTAGGSCGCGGGAGGAYGCESDANHGIYPDGRGAVMAKNGKELVTRLDRQDPSWLNRAAYNLAGSDVTPEQIPSAHSQLREQLLQAQPGTATPAAKTSTLPPAAPGAGAINSPAIPVSEFLGSWNGNAVVQQVGSVNTRVTEIGSNILRFGHQVPALSAETLQRLVRVPMAG